MRLVEPRPRCRKGFSLIEVCLVLALLVVIASIAMPMIGGSFNRQTLVSGADKLRSGLSRARLAAMQSGQTYGVRLEPKGRRYQILSLDQLSLPENQELAPDNPDAENSPSDLLRLSKNQLPAGVIFGRADVANSNQLAATVGDTTGGAWSSPILFRPDGTTSDATILLVNEPGQTVRVTLRGLTGTALASDVGKEPVP